MSTSIKLIGSAAAIALVAFGVFSFGSDDEMPDAHNMGSQTVLTSGQSNETVDKGEGRQGHHLDQSFPDINRDLTVFRLTDPQRTPGDASNRCLKSP